MLPLELRTGTIALMKRLVLMFVLAGVFGVGTAVGAIWVVGQRGAVQIGPWHTPLDAGSTDRGIYTRAAIAVGATLGLARGEAIYFRATTDSTGRPLSGSCRYHVTGAALPARWWSLTLYGQDHYLIANQSGNYSVNSVAIGLEVDKSFVAVIGPGATGRNAIDSGRADRLVLLLRLYQLKAQVASNLALLSLPAIQRVDCS